MKTLTLEFYLVRGTTATMRGIVTLRPRWRWRLRAANGWIICTPSESYLKRTDATHNASTSLGLHEGDLRDAVDGADVFIVRNVDSVVDGSQNIVVKVLP